MSVVLGWPSVGVLWTHCLHWWSSQPYPCSLVPPVPSLSPLGAQHQPSVLAMALCGAAPVPVQDTGSHHPRWWRVLSRELSVEIVTIHIRPWQTWPWASSFSCGAVLGVTQDLGVLQGLGVHSGVPLPWNGDDCSLCPGTGCCCWAGQMLCHCLSGAGWHRDSCGQLGCTDPSETHSTGDARRQAVPMGREAAHHSQGCLEMLSLKQAGVTPVPWKGRSDTLSAAVLHAVPHPCRGEGPQQALV